MRLTPGTRVGPYEVVALLGAGGMAEVYRAKDTRLGRDVALKVVSEALGTDPALVERFEREAKLAGSLNHPNVVALYDVGFQDGKPYFVTELLQGESLRERLAKPIPLATALEWAAQMAQGLAAAHERGIAHRDLKPENVFVTRDGHVKLIDFGIAKLVEAAREAAPHGLMDETASPSGSRTGTGMVLGTPGYMSPEQVRGDAVDARTDFFSLGAVLYEMLCGRRAFPSGSVVESGYAILHDEPEPLPENIPPAVAQVVRRCLEKDPSRRFQSARDLAFHLELLRAPTGSASSGIGPARGGSRTSRWVRRSLWPLASTLVALSLAAVTYFVGRDSRPRPPSVQSLVSRLGRVSAGRFNPDGRVIFSAAWDGQPLEVFAQTPGSLEAQPLGLRDMALLAVSTTGELAVLVRPDFLQMEMGTLALVPGVGGTPREVAQKVLFADWSPSGELVVLREVDGRYRLEYPLGTVLVDGGNGLHHPRLSPSGDSVAFFDGSALKVVNRKGQVRTLSSGVDGFNLAWVPSGEEVWFSSRRDRAIWAASIRTGGLRLVYQGVFEMEVEDISKEGRVLVNALERRWEVAFAPPGNQPDVRLSSYESRLAALSDDGQQVLSSSGSTGISLRPTDGGAPLKLGQGFALALSHDGKWVLAENVSMLAEHDSGNLLLLPIGPDVPRSLAVGDLIVNRARFLYGGDDIVFIGRHPKENHFHLYKMPMDGGTPVAISDFNVWGFDHFEVSPDDRLIATLNAERILTVYPTNGGSPLPLGELGEDTEAVAWTPEGHLWVRRQRLRELPNRILLYDITARRVMQERPFSLNDATGVSAVFRSLGTPDGGAIAFDYPRVLGHLYLLDGLAPALR